MLPFALAVYLFSLQFKHHLTLLSSISQGTALGQHALSQRISCYSGVFLVEGVRYPFNKYFRNPGRVPLLFQSLVISFLNILLGNHNTHSFQPAFSRHRTTPMALNFNFSGDGKCTWETKKCWGQQSKFIIKSTFSMWFQANLVLATWLLEQCSLLY